eukprot:6185435-Pleurochrysis_carterae.AAC.1
MSIVGVSFCRITCSSRRPGDVTVKFMLSKIPVARVGFAMKLTSRNGALSGQRREIICLIPYLAE